MTGTSTMSSRAVTRTLRPALFLMVMSGSGSALLAANTAPVAAPDAVETHARQAVLIDLLANDGDADGDPLTVSITSGPGLGSLVDHGDGTVTYTPDPALFEGAGGDGFGYTVSDGRGGSTGATVTVSELPVPPERQPIVTTVLFGDDFSAGLSNWTILDFGPAEGPSNWSIVNEELVQSSNIREDGKQKGTYAVYTAGSGATWTDYRVRAKLAGDDDDHIGIVFRYQDDRNHYRYISSRQGNYRRLEKLVNDEITILAEDAVPYPASEDWLVEIVVEGSQIEFRIDDQPVYTVTDASFSSGTIGLLAHAMQGAHFDDIRVTELPEEPPPLLLEDRFDDGDFDGWMIADSGRTAFPSNWQVNNGELVESSNIRGSIFVGAPGTAAVFEAGHHWDDYRFQVQMRATDNDSVILLFRFQDWQNYYAFHWNRQSNFRRIEKFIEGQVVVLANESGGYDSFDTYVVEVVAEDDRLEIWVDGHPMLQAVDDTFGGGTVGLSCAAMNSAIFDNVKVTAIP